MRSAYSHAQNHHCSFPLANLIREGQRQHRERCLQNFPCRTCSERFETWTERYQHETLDHFLCAWCPQRTFDTSEAFNLHCKTQHSGTWCDFCNQDLKSKDLLEIHKNSAGCKRPRQAKKTSSSEWATWYCGDCKRQFKSQDGFRAHRKYIHNSRDAGDGNTDTRAKNSSSTWHQVPGYCPDCEVDYITKKRLQEHINRGHDERSAKRPPEPDWKPKQDTPPLRYCKPQNFYDRLGVSPSTSQSEIGKAAKMKRIETHPDRVKREGMTDMELAAIDTRAKDVGEAADVLGDERKRRKYDRILRSDGKN
ncbi:MAG: hypothetical protein Q9214_004127 [Letrouitia sp. 1 TL-2023]